MNILDIIRLAFNNVKANKLRAILTMTIIAFGIMAIVGILSAIDAAIYSMGENFSTLGANTYTISPRNTELQSTRQGRTVKRAEPITFRQAMEFKERFEFPARVSVAMTATGSATVKYKDEKTNPTVVLLGADENELLVRGEEIEFGRYFNAKEVEIGASKVVIGKSVIDMLFDGKGASSLGKVISVNGRRYQVIGTLKSKGSSMNQQGDRRVIIPIVAAKNIYGTDRTNYGLSIGVRQPDEIDNAIAATIPIMRNVRRLKIAEENDFDVEKSNSLVDILKDNTVMLRMAALFIGIITLIGAAIGLMNIMLVSVTERTKEVGIVKAIGATRKNVVYQFLAEAMLICQMGGIIGILLGVGVGYMVSRLFDGTFIIPWMWIILGFLTCMIVGLVSGIYPATKAAKLDPIESLRYE